MPPTRRGRHIRSSPPGLLPIPALHRRRPIHPVPARERTNPPVREKLSAEESAAMGAQLVQEIETLPEDELQPRAIAILKSKNRLSVVDAKLVEDAFAARMAQRRPSVESMTTDQPVSVPVSPILPQPHPASSDIVKRPRGRSRKVRPVVEPSGPPAAPRTQSLLTISHMRSLSKHAPFPARSTRACSRSANRGGSATKPTLNS